MVRKKANLLDQIPTLKAHLKLTTEEGQAFLLVPRKNPIEKFAIRFMKQRATRTIKLDEEGALILNSLDGVKKVTDLEQVFNEHFGNEDDMSLARLVRFLQIVDSYGWLEWKKT
ncbi:PqqD family peptide modification chaperone [Listeria sp. PSOL-1]|uniref:PqqD family peptide modification chaperone n=1 Tax=Listeria sp. PSOL-1 TaxID=1844999 RepID=UPI0013D1718B|nr:PqqD family peptide modification chaperone [Listeria sp. PSOL-1]